MDFQRKLLMDGSRVSDFSIQRILSPQLGLGPQMVDGYQRTVPGGFSLDSGCLFRPPAPVPVPVPVPIPVPVPVHHGGLSFGDAFFPCGAAFHPPDFPGLYPNCGLYQHFNQDSADAQTPAGYNGYQPTGGSVPSRQKARMRTVFTDSQAKQLEMLFELTDYPTAEARAELAGSAGLSEETVRVWFKNRRARRKRQRSGSKVRSPCSSPDTPTERKLLTQPSS